MRLIVVVETVGTQYSYQRRAFNLNFGNVGKIYAGSIALELHIEAEFFTFDIIAETIHVFHHQIPVALSGIIARILQ